MGRRRLPLVIRRGLRIAVLWLVSAGTAQAAVVEMNTSVPGCAGYASETEVGVCATDPAVVDVTWALQGPETLNGYDFEVRWDPSELTLVSATQLFPDTGTPIAFTEAPSSPADSRAAVFTITAGETTALFRLRFSVMPSISDSAPDVWWFPNSEGLAPLSVVLENPAGASIDFVRPASLLPALNGAGAALLGALLALSARRALRSAPEPR